MGETVSHRSQHRTASIDAHNDDVVRRIFAHVSPEELLLIPVLILAIIGAIAQPDAITRLFETPYATPSPGDSPADEGLQGR